MARLKRRGKIWHYDFQIGGKRSRASTGTADRNLAAEIAAAAENAARRADRFGEEGLITFGEAAVHYLDAGKSDRYLTPLLDRLDHMAVRDLSGEFLRRIALELYPAHSAATRNRQALNPAAAVINHAADLGYCQPLRLRRFKVSRKPRPAGDWTWALAFHKAAMGDGNPRIGALALFMFTTGARITQACQLRWADVDLGAATALVPPAKGFEQRRAAALVPETLAAIASLALPGQDEAARVFGYVSRHSATKTWNRVIARHGLAKLTPHEAGRHGFGTQMIVRAGIDAPTAASAGGWASPRVLTETYAHAEREREAVTKAFKRG